MYLENLDEWVLEENKVVTYKFLSRGLNVHVNTAKQMLWNFVHNKNGSCKGVVYLVSGHLKDNKGNKVCLIKEEELKKTLEDFDKVFSQHVYSVQLNQAVSASSIFATDLEVFKEDPFASCQLVGISNPAAVLRAAEQARKIAPGVSLVKAEKPVKNETKKVGGIENAFSKVKKPSELDNKSSPSSSAKEKPKSPEKKATNTKKPQAGGIANFFMKQAAKPKVVADKREIKEETESKKEIKKENESEKNTGEEKENKGNHQSDTKSTEKPKENDKAVIKPTKKVEKKSFGKRDKEAPKVLDDTKKRKRIQVMSDSEDEEKSEEETHEDEVETEAPPQAKLLESEDEEDPIPATPKANIEASRTGRRRVKKQVDKTYMDEDGYMVTKKVLESGSETDDDVEEPKVEAESVKSEPKKEVTEAPPSKKAKVVASGAKNQKGIQSFFTKK